MSLHQARGMTESQMLFKTKRLVRLLRETTRLLGDDAGRLEGLAGDTDALVALYAAHPEARKKFLEASDLIDELAAGMHKPREVVIGALFNAARKNDEGVTS